MKVKELAENLKTTTVELINKLSNVIFTEKITEEYEVSKDLEKKLAKMYGVSYPFKSNKPKSLNRPAVRIGSNKHRLSSRFRYRPPMASMPAFAARYPSPAPATTNVSHCPEIVSQALRMACTVFAVSASGCPSQPKNSGAFGWLLRRCRCASNRSFSHDNSCGSDTQLQILDNSTLIIRNHPFPVQKLSYVL